MALAFTKMHGLGNDFVVLDATQSPITLDTDTARRIADRHYGIGCDQILIVAPPKRRGSDFTYRIYNADGSEAGQCGNGARCFMRYVQDAGLTTADRIVVDVPDGRMTLENLGSGQYRAALGVPRFSPADIPLDEPAAADVYTRADVAGQTVSFAAVSIGNPHAVVAVESVADAPVARLGPALESHAAFPARVNVGFREVVARDHIRLRVYERGAGETLACGSGAVAAVVTGIAAGTLDAEVAVHLPGGTACVQWAGAGEPAYLVGPAERVYEGRLLWSVT